jgi:opacity protein-like surface antigen
VTQHATSVTISVIKTIGFLLSTGLNYIVSNNIKVYGEYKFQTVDHTSSLDDGVSYELTNESSSIVFGASYSF